MAKHKNATVQDDKAPHERRPEESMEPNGAPAPEINPIDGRPMMSAEQTAALPGALSPLSANGKPPVKTKRERFVELAPARVNKALKALAAVARCADARSYEYSSDEAQRIVAALDAAMDALTEQFNGGKKPSVAFTL